MKIKHLYIHVPFCNSICAYCDFCHVKYNKEKVDAWLKQLSKEIDANCLDQYETIYIGGGTPSSLNINQLKELLELIKPFSNEVIEYTIEINPESIDENKIKLFKEYGINRISMGIQSSDDALLKILKRNHQYLDCINAISLLREYDLNNISIDLMYGLPQQDINILNKTLDDILKLDLPHISIYSLTIEENTLFFKQGIKEANDDLQADMYELIINKLESYNYSQYEVSNFSKEGYESKHNIGYWLYEDYLGISCGSASKINHIRYENTNNINEYLKDWTIKDEYIKLDKKEEIFENIMMSLRMKKGLNIIDFNKKYRIDLLKEYENVIKNNDNLIIEDNYLKCKNLAILNNTLLDFME